MCNAMKKTIAILAGVLLSITIIPTNLSYAADQSQAYQIISTSENGLRMARDNKTGLFGYVNEEGTPVTPFTYDYALPFNDGIAMVKNASGEYIAINTKGETVITFKKELGNINFYGDYGTASLPTGLEDPPEKYALLDKDGKLLTGFDYDMISRSSYYAGSKLCFYGPIFVSKNGKGGIIDKTGEILMPLEYDGIQASSNGEYNIFSVYKKVGDIYKYGYINGEGKVIFDCIYDGTGDFAAGYGTIVKNGKAAVVNTNGTIITNFVYDSMDIFSEGLAPVQIKGLWGCIDVNGNLVIPCKYDSMGWSENGNIDFYLQDGITEVKLQNPLIAQRDINIYLNGQWIYSDQPPIIQNGRTLAPFSAVADVFGYNVDWDSNTQSVTLQNKSKIIHLKIGSNEAVVNTFDDGKAPKTVLLDVPAQLVGGRTFVPVRFLAENTGAEVTWNKDSRTIEIKTK